MRSPVAIYTQTNASGNLASEYVGQMFSCSVIASFTDVAAAGTLKMQASNDLGSSNGSFTNQFVPTVWVDIAGAAATSAAGASIIIPKFDICYQYIRLVWTKTGGAGTYTVKLNMLGA